jgi:hypothetical protein
MPSYQIVFVGGGDLNREPMDIHCADDGQAMRWASGLLRDHLGAEVFEGVRKVGWVTTSGGSGSAT